MQEALYMGSMSLFVWGAYGITVVVLVLCMVLTSLRKKQIFKEIKETLEQ